MTDIPPRARLDTVLEALARDLPRSHGTLLEAQELEAGREALSELGDAATRRRVVDALDDAEAAWVGQRLAERWARLGGNPGPIAALIGPTEAWLVGDDATVNLSVAVDGLVPGWTVHWPPETSASEDAGTARFRFGPSDVGSDVEITVRVVGRVNDSETAPRRVVLVAHHRIVVRRPRLSLDDSRTVLEATDNAGQPATGLTLTIDGEERIVPDDGRIAFDAPLAPGISVAVAGVPVGIENE